jgi:lipopolysaccharide transport system permease protein
MILLNMMFYVSPVLYPIALVPETYRVLIWMNPMTSALEAWRGVFLQGALDWNSIGVVYAYAALSTALGGWVYRRLSPRFAETV